MLDQRVPRPIRQYLTARGLQVVTTCALEGLLPPLNTHTDLQIIQVGEQLICAPCLLEYYKQHLPQAIPGAASPKGRYPYDARYNALVVGKRVFHRTDITDPVVLAAAKKQGFSLVPVRQGYAACSSLVVSEEAVITADAGMARAFLECGLDVCRISPGNIALSKFPYGFIGGAGGRLGTGEILFFGTPTEERIFSFLSKHGKTGVFFPGGLADFGGWIMTACTL